MVQLRYNGNERVTKPSEFRGALWNQTGEDERRGIVVAELMLLIGWDKDDRTPLDIVP